MSRRLLMGLAVLALAAVFIVAALPKIADPHDFALAIYRHQFAPPWAINAMAIYLPWIELTTSVALLIPRLRRAAALVLLVLLAAFTALIAYDLWRGLDIACGCFSVKPGGDAIGWWNLLRNLALLTLAGVLYRSAAGGGQRMPHPR
ncbi:MAG: DoxX family membrane protein [Lentisphaerae bacterium]|nr:DoxX family membrane protein [Lentisphaerota bacterium]